jgi:aldose 1-epimerase
MKKIIYIITGLLLLVSCKEKETTTLPLIDKNNFAQNIEGKEIALYTLTSKNGLTVEVTNFGGRIVSIWAPGNNGKYEDVVLGFDNINDYLTKPEERFLGPVVGRYANRIAKGQFQIDSINYQLPVNNNGQTLHGGNKCLDMVIWEVDSITDNQIHLSYLSPDGEEGFPGNLKINMIYTVTDNNELKIEYKATTDKPTVVNLSNHSIFNLKGYGNGTTSDHILTIYANSITPVDSVLIPTGVIMPVEGTAFDFRQPKEIGKDIDDKDIQLQYGNGYDHNWVLDKKSANQVELAAVLYEPKSGRIMEIWTDQPGLQFYSGNFFNGKTSGKGNKPMKYREGIALETQKFPDSPNHKNFPSTRLNPNEIYTHICIYKFSSK